MLGLLTETDIKTRFPLFVQLTLQMQALIVNILF